MEFKIGDIVTVIDNRIFVPSIHVGRIGKIIRESCGMWDIDFSGTLQCVSKEIAEEVIRKTSEPVSRITCQFFPKASDVLPRSIMDGFLRKLRDQQRQPQFKLIFNKPATILFYNGKKYIVKATKGDKFDEEKGFLLAFAKAHGLGYKEIENIVKNAKRGETK